MHAVRLVFASRAPATGFVAVRVIGGSLGGRRLRAPRSGVRPTSDRVRESLFAILGDLTGVRVLDLYAGTGALGIEALSRGAESAVFIDANVEVLRANLAALDLLEQGRVLKSDASRGVRRLGREGARFDLALADPPYDTEIDGLLEALPEAGILLPGATLVIERRRGHAVPAVAGMARVDERQYGDTVLTRFVAEDERGS